MSFEGIAGTGSRTCGPTAARPGLSAGAAACVAAGLTLTLAALIFPGMLGVSLLLPAGRDVVVWTSWSRALAVAGFICWASVCWSVRRSAHHRAGSGTADAIILPLTLLPLSLIGFLLRPLVPQAAAANLLFFLPVLLAATSLFRWLQKLDAAGSPAVAPARGAIAAGIALWIFYALVGCYFTVSMSKPPGDTGHYLVLAESLYRDHDLDLRNNIGAAAEEDPERMHISKFSRNGRAYSWHSIGLPLLLAPFTAGGAPARHLVLALFVGLCGAGIWELCRLFGAPRHWSLTALLLFVLSRYWGTYSSLCLPEVAGAALTAWGVVAALRQHERPWRWSWLAVSCCACLPWLHTRFIPVSLALIGIFAATAFLDGRRRRSELLRLGFVAAAYIAALAAFFAFQLTLFTGGLPLPPGLLLGYPLGIWYAIAHQQGLLSVLPLAAGMIGASLWILLRDPPNRRGAATAMLLTAIVLATASGTEHWRGGATYPGRFLLVVIPLFVPCLARALGKASPVARWWAIFLGLIPCLQFLLVLAGLPEMGDLNLIFDHLNGLMEYVAANDNRALRPFALVLLLGTGLLFFVEAGRTRLALALTAAMVVVAAAFGDVALGPRVQKFREAFNARRLAQLGSRLEGASILSRGDAPIIDLFDVSDRFRRERFPGGIDQTSAPAASNDWAGRGFRWVTLAEPFEAGAGWRACRLTGRLASGTTAQWAVREGSDTLYEGPLAAGPDGAFAVTVKVLCRNRGRVVIALRFEDDRGILQNPAVAWTPYSQALLAEAGFRL
jgi:hypothetical protein